MVTATKPWDAINTGDLIYSDDGRWVRSDLTTYDDQAQIELCLRCKYADDCHDCLAYADGTEKQKGRPRKKSDLLDRLILSGASVRSVAKAAKVSASTVSRRRKELLAQTG